MLNRIIGQYKGAEPGPLVIIFGAIHGNEPAGIHAIESVFRMLDVAADHDPLFTVSGKIIGLIGNLRALATGQRFLEKDLNRIWTIENLRHILEMDSESEQGEYREMAELYEIIRMEIRDAQPEVLILLDLHTTSAEGGIFSIPSDDKASLRLAKELHAPVILGLLGGIEGTLLDFAAGKHFNVGPYPAHTLGIAFEAGQHDDPLSVSRSISAILSCLQTCGAIQPEEADNEHDRILKQHSAQFPKVTRLNHVHHIMPGDTFRMRPGYVNFQPVQIGEYLADDVGGPILAPNKGLILMPLYQAKGSDGFFIVQEVK